MPSNLYFLKSIKNFKSQKKHIKTYKNIKNEGLTQPSATTFLKFNILFYIYIFTNIKSFYKIF